ncbi:MAG: hypothetical protein LBU34_14210 [Planctomycetaceae bacterium]|nr:hypothetical protein [Planctomycetaceae bacterium]
MDNYPPRCGGLAYIALSGRRTSRLSPTQSWVKTLRRTIAYLVNCKIGETPPTS